jgi:hypothetical protein
VKYFNSIRTTEEKAEIEELPHTKNMNADDLDKLMSKNPGMHAGQSTMTVPTEEISRINSSGKSSRDETLIGTLKISI